MSIMFSFNDSDFKFGVEVGDKVIDNKSIFYIVIFEIDLNIFKSIETSCSNQLANLIHFCSTYILFE